MCWWRQQGLLLHSHQSQRRFSRRALQLQSQRSVPHTSGDSQGLLGCLVSLLLWLLSAMQCPPIPIGRTPGFLSRAISRQAKRGEIDFGSTYEVQILLATRAKEWHSSLDLPLNDVHSLLHPCASMPDGPANPVVCMAAERMTLVSIDSKMTGCVSWGGGDWSIQLTWVLTESAKIHVAESFPPINPCSISRHRRRNQGGTGGTCPPKFSVCSIYVLYYKVIYYILCPPNQKVFPTPLLEKHLLPL